MDSAGDLVKSVLSWSTYVGMYELGMAVYHKEISLSTLAIQSVKSAIAPAQHVTMNAKHVFGGKPTNKEVRTYGKNLGEVLMSIGGSGAAIKTIAKVAPKLAKMLKKLGSKSDSKSGKFSCNCFTAGTKVQTDEGEKPIEEIEVGDRVLAKSDETGEQAYKEVVGLFQKQADEIYYVHIGDEIIEVTGEHPFWLNGKGWTLVKDLKVGDLLVSSDGTTLPIDQIEKEPREATVYNFEVADFNSYFVSNLGIWVHNCAVKSKWWHPGYIDNMSSMDMLLGVKKSTKGLSTLGSAKRANAWEAGRNWVGLNAKPIMENDTLIGYSSADGMRAFRLQFKKGDKMWRANFQQNTNKSGSTVKKAEVFNVHVDILD
ncbi:Hint module [compost metagenome]